jgi:Holliday junction resolvase RusA-like endonuclease
MKIEFTVPGEPVGKGRPRFTKDGHTYTPQKTRDYEDKIVQCWKCQSGKGFAAGVPLAAHITAYFPLPKSLSKKRAAAMDGTPHTKRPDADNVAKAILDALNTHAYNDDSAIASLTVWKYQTTGASRVEVTIEEAE